ERVLSWLEGAFDSLLAEAGQDADRLRGVGVGLPGPGEFATGRPVTPPIMPGWHLYPVGQRLAERFGVLALVDNDVNIMAVGEHWSRWRDEAFLMFVKVGTGIGCGLVGGGHVHPGARGARPELTPPAPPMGRRGTSATSMSPIKMTSYAVAATSAAWKPSPAAARWPRGSPGAGGRGG